MSDVSQFTGYWSNKEEGSLRLRKSRVNLYVRLNQVTALLLLLIFSPVLIAVTWAIWRGDGTPILFGHYRVGLNGRLFRCLKFRTMARDSQSMLEELLRSDPNAMAEWRRDRKLSRDPRITPIGDFLRRTSLDELPQLLNVIRGEMLLVGPRPITYSELSEYGDVRWHYLSVRPGITGLWQVSGRSNLSYAQRVELDRQYVETRSWLKDLLILARTVRTVALRDGAR